jgi:phospholipid/cholesterol/gamma-HCH transport system permease protein
MATETPSKLSASFDQAKHQLLLTLSGRLDIDRITRYWQEGLDLQQTHQPKTLLINAEQVDFCDGAGVAFLLELEAVQKKNKAEFQIQGLAASFQKLLATIRDVPEHKLASSNAATAPLTFAERVGAWVMEVATGIRDNFIYLGALSSEVVGAFFHPKSIRWKDVWRTMEKTGPDGVILIFTLGLIIGLILSFQAAAPLQKFGAKVYIINLVGVSLTRELGPLFTAIIVAGRTSSAFAAEIGTMQVNQEIDALQTLGISPLLFLAVPRIISVMFMMPFLTVVMIAAGLIGSAVFMGASGYGWEVFYQQLVSAVSMGDFVGGLVKSVVFGVLLAGIGCMYGLRTKFGASAVGDSTTKAVVSCLIMLVVVDSVFAIVFYTLGI